jgi:hypothetical protein
MRLPYAAGALARTTGFSPEEVQGIMDLLARRTARGPAEDFHPTALQQLGGRGFAWPEFDRWQAFFAHRRQFPPLWEDVRVVPGDDALPDRRRAYDQAKLYLLLDWLFALEVTRIELGEALVRYARKGVQAEVVRQAERVPCPICAPLHRQAVGTPHRLPPFHPGCRCVILAAATPKPRATAA